VILFVFISNNKWCFQYLTRMLRGMWYFNNWYWTCILKLIQFMRCYRSGDDAMWWNSSLHCATKFSYRGRDNYVKRRISCSHASLSTSAFNELTNKRTVCKRSKRSKFVLRRKHLNACELNCLTKINKNAVG